MANFDHKSDPDYKNLINLLAVLSEANTRQKSLSAQVLEEYLGTVDTHREEYSEHQTALAQAEDSIQTIVKRHPEWFIDRKTLTTPYGKITLSRSTKIDAPSEDAALQLIKAAGRAADFIRTTEELDKDALDRLTDEELAKFGIRRLPTESFTIKPIEIDLGKAIAEAAKQKEAA